MRLFAVIDEVEVAEVLVFDDEPDAAALATLEQQYEEVVEVTDYRAQHGYGVNRGFVVSEDDGLLRPKQPFPSWTWAGTEWEAPVPMPPSDVPLYWNEADQAWQA